MVIKILNRRKYNDSELDEILKSMIILIDTAEKKIDHITDYYDKHNIQYKRMKLPSFDYSFMIPKNEKLGIQYDMTFYNDCSLERKRNLEEISTNFSSKRVQFNDEFSRSWCKNKHLLIENANYQDIVNGNYNTQYNKKSFLGSLHSFSAKYGLHIMFLPDDSYSAIYIYGVFQYYLRYLIK